MMTAVDVYLSADPDDRRTEVHGRAGQFQFQPFGLVFHEVADGEPAVIVYPWHRVKRVELDQEAQKALL
jgi:hypothetical protein